MKSRCSFEPISQFYRGYGLQDWEARNNHRTRVAGTNFKLSTNCMSRSQVRRLGFPCSLGTASIGRDLR